MEDSHLVSVPFADPVAVTVSILCGSLTGSPGHRSSTATPSGSAGAGLTTSKGPFDSAQLRTARTTMIGDAAVSGPCSQSPAISTWAKPAAVSWSELLASAEVQLAGEGPDRATVDDVVCVEYHAAGIVHAGDLQPLT